MLLKGSGHPELVSGSYKILKQVQHDRRFLFVFFLLIFSFSSYSEKKEIWRIDSTGTVLQLQIIETDALHVADDAPNPLFKLFRKKQKDKRKLTAALLAFPFPFGIVGLHRIFLGTKPYVPVAYIASLGGIFGVLPLIDFFVICFDKDFEQYLNNPKVLMWVE